MDKYNDTNFDLKSKYKKIDVFDLHPFNEYIENIRRNIIYELLDLSQKLDQLKCCEKKESIKKTEDIIDIYLKAPEFQTKKQKKTVNIKAIIDKFNNIMTKLSNVFNSYVDSINSLNSINIPPEFDLGSVPKFDMKYVIYEPLVFESYDVAISQELIDFLYKLKNDTINLYKTIISIPDMIPKFQSIEEIEKKIEQELIKRYLI